METLGFPTGRVRVHRVPNSVDRKITEWQQTTEFVANAVLYEWASIVSKLLTQGKQEYRISAMYIEYENCADPEDPVTVPTFSRDAASGIAYYNSLSLSTDRDYLRVPIIAATIGVSDEAKYPNGNVPTFYAQTFDLIGVHGKPFSENNNSKVFGGALVAVIDEDDRTQDLVMSRFYLPVDQQQLKLATAQIGLEWQVQLT